MNRDRTDFEVARAQELLVQRATEGLDDAAREELAQLGADDVEGFDVAAAAVDLATLPQEAMPSALADQVFAAAMAAMPRSAATAATAGPSHAASTAPAVPVVPASLPVPSPSTRSRAPAAPPPVATRRRWARPLAIGGWAMAAASTALAVGLWTDRRPAQGARPPAAARSELLTVDDSVTLPFAPSPDPAMRTITGDVVWSARRQRGALRLIGLPRNQPLTARYQVWIFDRGRDDRFPVDGGVFDAAATDPTVVTIDPRLPVTAATRFLITVEAPGGTVVSDRQRVVGAAVTPDR